LVDKSAKYRGPRPVSKKLTFKKGCRPGTFVKVIIHPDDGSTKTVFKIIVYLESNQQGIAS